MFVRDVGPRFVVILSAHNAMSPACAVLHVGITPVRHRLHRVRYAGMARMAPRGSRSQVSAALNNDGFDARAYDAERLALDAQAMAAMEEAAKAAMTMGEDEAAEEALEARGAWKWAIRKRIWDRLEETNIAQFPRPVHHRIPNFLNAEAAAQNLASLDCFKRAQCVKVNPDTPQKPLRFLVLSQGKTLMTPQPRLRTGFFSVLSKHTVPNDNKTVKQCCTSAGVAKHGKPIAIDADVKVDVVVIGSCAVDVNTGARLGKGEGFAELEYGILRMMGAIDENTPVVTTVHDEQLVDDIPTDKLLRHDVPVDIICTPTRIIHTNTKIPKPDGIYWDLLSPQKLAQVKVLRDLKAKKEAEQNAPLPTGPDEELPPLAVRAEKDLLKKGKSRRGSVGGKKAAVATDPEGEGSTRLFVTGVGQEDTWRDVKRHVGEATGASYGDQLAVKMLRPKSKGGARAAILTFTKSTAAAKALDALNGSDKSSGLEAQWARNQPGGGAEETERKE